MEEEEEGDDDEQDRDEENGENEQEKDVQYEAGEEQEEKRSSLHSLRRRYFVMHLVAALGCFLLATAGLLFVFLLAY